MKYRPLAHREWVSANDGFWLPDDDTGLRAQEVWHEAWCLMVTAPDAGHRAIFERAKRDVDELQRA